MSAFSKTAVALANLDMFKARCEGRAPLWAIGEISDLHTAADKLQAHAVKRGPVRQIDQDRVELIIAGALRPVRAGKMP